MNIWQVLLIDHCCSFGLQPQNSSVKSVGKSQSCALGNSPGRVFLGCLLGFFTVCPNTWLSKTPTSVKLQSNIAELCPALVTYSPTNHNQSVSQSGWVMDVIMSLIPLVTHGYPGYLETWCKVHHKLQNATKGVGLTFTWRYEA